MNRRNLIEKGEIIPQAIDCQSIPKYLNIPTLDDEEFLSYEKERNI